MAPNGFDTRTSNVLEPLQIYSAMRGQIEHEDNLINARIIWPLPPILIPCLFIASWTALLLRHAFE